ncbi:MAG: NAD-dependent epimerase/dehydratase family protein [Bacteroidia bacterium]|nr:NAD-dependent epimerase/dehydratase family protein [Bacteroidia bacterium]
MTKVLLLGASGFVGKNVAQELQNKNINLVTSSLSAGCDLRNLAQTEELIKNTLPDIIVNCAAHVGSLNYVTKKAASVTLDNTRMLMNMYEAVANIHPTAIIINPVANCAYPAKVDTFVEDQWWDGHLHRSVLSYGSTRRFMWSLGESFDMQYGVRSIYLLVPNMYGPHDSSNPDKAHALNALISKFVKAEKENKNEIEVWGTGIAIREWLYAPDFGKIVAHIVAKPTMIGLTEPVNIARNFGLSVKELVTIINDRFNNQFIIRWNHNMPDGAQKKVMDDVRFKKVFPGFEFTDFEIGITNTVNYYKSIYPY